MILRPPSPRTKSSLSVENMPREIVHATVGAVLIFFDISHRTLTSRATPRGLGMPATLSEINSGDRPDFFGRRLTKELACLGRHPLAGSSGPAHCWAASFAQLSDRSSIITYCPLCGPQTSRAAFLLVEIRITLPFRRSNTMNMP